MRVSKGLFSSLQGMVTGLFMSLVLSFAMLLLSVGLVDGFLLIWLSSFVSGFLVSVPVGMLVVPLTERLLRRFFRVVE